MPYDWKIELSGVDITDKVARFQIDADLAQYCRELTVEIADPAFYAGLDFSTIPEAPTLEVFTMTAATWVSQGKYFMERPALSSDINQDIINGLWGRGETARLGAPFAPRISKMWTATTSFFAICAEMCQLAGLTWDDSQSAIDDFYIFAYTYQVENAYPVDVLSELADLAGALLTSDRLGRLLIQAIDYAPATAAATITDDDWAAIQEAPEWPDFGNRVRIIPAGSLASTNIALWVPDPCLPADGATRAKVLARVTDPDGAPQNGAVVSWQLAADAASLAATETNAVETVMPVETVRARNRYQVAVSYPPSQVLGVWAYADYRMTDNLATGAVIEDSTITLAAPLDFCDQLVRVQYMVAGLAVNHVVAGSTAEDVTVTAAIGGGRAQGELFVGNDCACPARLTLTATPASIETGGLAELVTCAEEQGPITDGRMIYNYERGETKIATLTWGTARLGSVTIRAERSAAVNDVAGVSQCDTAHYIGSGSVDVRMQDINGAAYGGNLYASHDGKRIDLSAKVPTGQALAVTYTAIGCARNWLRGNMAGTAHLKAWMKSTQEAGLEAEARVRVTDPSDPLAGDLPDDYTPGGYGGTGGDSDGLESLEEGCMAADGSISNCDGGDDWNTERICCEVGGVPGCYPRQDCDGYLEAGQCVPTNLSDQPNLDSGDRFTAPRMTGCTCEQICAAELDVYGTTQTYDGGSARSLAEILAEDYGLTEQEGGDNTAYWAQYDTLRQEALNACVEECNALEFTCSPDNPEIIGDLGTVGIAVVGGTVPFTWAISPGDKFSIGESQTSDRANSVTALEGACGGVSVTCTDARDESVTCTLRHESGHWVYVGDPAECLVIGPATEVHNSQASTLIRGRYKVYEEKWWSYKCSNGGAWLDTCKCSNCLNFGSHGDKACITGYEQCQDWNGQHFEYIPWKCCQAFFYSDGTPMRTIYCVYVDFRAQYEWRC